MIIEDIIDHGEHVDSLRGYDEMGFVDTESLPTLGASLHLKTQSLPILDNLVRMCIIDSRFYTHSSIGYTNSKLTGEGDVSGNHYHSYRSRLGSGRNLCYAQGTF